MTSKNNSEELQVTDNFAIVNIVGTGNLGDDDFQLSLEALKENLPYETYESDGDNPGLYMKFDEGDALTTFYESGKFIIRLSYGSEDELFEKYEKVKQTLVDLGLVTTDTDVDLEESDALLTIDEIDFEISNVVCLENLNTQLNLPALSIGLGLAEVEYEPEEFPALVFRKEEYPCTFMLFSNGKVVVAGAKSYEESRESLERFLVEVNTWVDDDF